MGTRERSGSIVGLILIVALLLAGCVLPPAPVMTPQAECTRSGGTWMATSCEHSAGGGAGM